MLNYITSGESHGKYLIALLEGMPSGLNIDSKKINYDLKRRQSGYGRGGRMQIETDTVTVTAGIYRGKTTGAPLGLMIKNNDVNIDNLPQLVRPRPGHADLVGSLKYAQGIREILERASARETALRVAVGSVCKQMLDIFNVQIVSHVIGIADVRLKSKDLFFDEIRKKTKNSKLNCISPALERKMIATIEAAKKRGDTLGGEIEIVVKGLPLGIGSHVHHERKLDARLAAGLMSVQAIKAVGFGLANEYALLPGSKAHDEIFYSKAKGYYRKTNHAGGIEGGMSNGENIVVRAVMKPIATLRRQLRSVDMKTKRTAQASFERSDICAVTACSVIAEAAVAYELARAFLEKFGGDSIKEITRNYKGYLKQIGR